MFEMISIINFIVLLYEVSGSLSLAHVFIALNPVNNVVCVAAISNLISLMFVMHFCYPYLLILFIRSLRLICILVSNFLKTHASSSLFPQEYILKTRKEKGS